MHAAKGPPQEWWLVVEKEQCLPRYRVHNLGAGTMTRQIQARWPVKRRHDDLMDEEDELRCKQKCGDRVN